MMYEGAFFISYQILFGFNHVERTPTNAGFRTASVGLVWGYGWVGLGWVAVR